MHSRPAPSAVQAGGGLQHAPQAVAAWHGAATGNSPTDFQGSARAVQSAGRGVCLRGGVQDVDHRLELVGQLQQRGVRSWRHDEARVWHACQRIEAVRRAAREVDWTAVPRAARSKETAKTGVGCGAGRGGQAGGRRAQCSGRACRRCTAGAGQQAAAAGAAPRCRASAHWLYLVLLATHTKASEHDVFAQAPEAVMACSPMFSSPPARMRALCTGSEALWQQHTAPAVWCCDWHAELTGYGMRLGRPQLQALRCQQCSSCWARN